MSDASFSWTSDPTARVTVFVEIEGDFFGYKFVPYGSREMPAVEHRFKVSGILKAEGYLDVKNFSEVAVRVGLALLRRRYRQTYMTQRHCATCCCC